MRQDNYRITLLGLAGILVAVIAVMAIWYGIVRNARPTPPRAILFTAWSIAPADVAALSGYDMVILNPIAAASSPNEIWEMKKMNKDIALLISAPMGWIADAYETAPSSFAKNLADTIQKNDWYMKGQDGNPLRYEAGAFIDVRDSGQGNRWNDFLPQFVAETYLQNQSVWDGVYYDFAWHDIEWAAKECDAMCADAWSSGVRTILTATARLAPGAIVIIRTDVNTTDFNDAINGKAFIAGNDTLSVWPRLLYRYVTDSYGRTPQMPLIMYSYPNEEYDDSFADFTLTTALLGDGFSGDVSAAANQREGRNVYRLGNAVAPAYHVIGTPDFAPVWMRQYTQGLVVVNAGGITQTVDLPRAYEVNGQLRSTVTLPPYSGRGLTE